MRHDPLARRLLQSLAMQLPEPGEGLRAFVRVLGVRREKFVEFSFAVSHEELSVELVMPLAAFLDFRDRYHAEMLDPAPAAALAFDDLMRRNVQP